MENEQITNENNKNESSENTAKQVNNKNISLVRRLNIYILYYN